MLNRLNFNKIENVNVKLNCKVFVTIMQLRITNV